MIDFDLDQRKASIIQWVKWFGCQVILQASEGSNRHYTIFDPNVPWRHIQCLLQTPHSIMILTTRAHVQSRYPAAMSGEYYVGEHIAGTGCVIEGEEVPSKKQMDYMEGKVMDLWS